MKIIGTTTSRTGRSRLRTVIGLIAAVVMTLSLVAPGSAGATGGGQSGGVSANPVFGPLSAKWWQWRAALISNSEEGPSAECDRGQAGSVFFLTGSFGNDPVDMTCEVPRGKALFFPLINIITYSDKPPGVETPESLWNDLHVKSDWKISSLSLKVGKVQVLNESPPSALYRGCAGPERGCAPRSFAITVLGEEYKPSIADGYYALIPPLPRGKTVIKFGGKGTRLDSSGKVEHLAQTVTYTVIVK